MSYKGIYKLSNPKKYAGNPNRIVYRSNWERRFMVYCDKNPEITLWASEELPIPYKNPIDKKVHRYFPDFIIKTAKGKKYMIEIKPKKYTIPPKPGKRKTKRFFGEQLEYIKNRRGISEGCSEVATPNSVSMYKSQEGRYSDPQ